ncbi:MAG: PhzF family phenazine biosynthesis protein [Bacteroidota bacterium]
MGIPYYQVDAFTDQLFRGNPAGVCPLDKWLPDDLMQQIAMENNLSETAFFVPQSGGFDLRWFTPAAEVDLCGHATLATAHVLFNHLQFEHDTITFHTRSGPLQVNRQENGLALNFPADRPHKAMMPEGLAAAFNLLPKEVWRGKDDLMLVYESAQEIRDLRPDLRLIAQCPIRGVIVTAPGTETDVVSRFFAPGVGVNEDPVTGSAHTRLAPYWSDRLGKTTLTAQQISARSGTLTCTVQGDRVVMVGQARTFLTGTILVGN